MIYSGLDYVLKWTIDFEILALKAIPTSKCHEDFIEKSSDSNQIYGSIQLPSFIIGVKITSKDIIIMNDWKTTSEFLLTEVLKDSIDTFLASKDS